MATNGDLPSVVREVILQLQEIDSHESALDLSVLLSDALDAVAGCFVNAAPDEPIFVLRAQDMGAARTVRFWAEDAYRNGSSPEKLAEAEAVAAAMDAWPRHKVAD